MLNSIKYAKDLCYSKIPDDNSTEKIRIIAKGDSAASVHYWREEEFNCLENIIDKKGTRVMLPDS